MTFWKWSTTAATNDSVDTTVNFREGQAPSTVNDSNRAMMAALAKYRDDISGTILTTGSSTAFAAATNQVTTALTNGFMVAFVPHTTSGTAPTLNVDSTGAKPLRGQAGVALPDGSLVASTPYCAVYKSLTDEWLLHGYFSQPSTIPIGGMMPFVGSTAPNSLFVLPYGQAVSRATYATLFALTSTAFGAGDGSTTFNLPDLRGRGIFGLDNMGGSTASRITNAVSGVTGTTIGASGGTQSVTIAQANMPNVTLTGTTNTETTDHFHDVANRMYNSGVAGGAGTGVLLDSSTNLPNVAQPNPPASGGRTASHTHGFTTSSINGNVTQTAVNNLPPAMILPYILRVI